MSLMWLFAAAWPAAEKLASEMITWAEEEEEREREMNVEGKGAERELTREKGRIAADRVRERWAKEGRRSRRSQNSTVILLLLFLVRKTFLVKCLIERIWMHASKRGFFSFSCHSAFKIVFVSERWYSRWPGSAATSFRGSLPTLPVTIH